MGDTLALLFFIWSVSLQMHQTNREQKEAADHITHQTTSRRREKVLKRFKRIMSDLVGNIVGIILNAALCELHQLPFTNQLMAQLAMEPVVLESVWTGTSNQKGRNSTRLDLAALNESEHSELGLNKASKTDCGQFGQQCPLRRQEVQPTS